MWKSQGQWRPSWKCHNMWHIRKMLFMLLLNSVPSLTVLTFCAQWMVLAALLQGLRASSLQFTSPLEFNAIFRDGFTL